MNIANKFISSMVDSGSETIYNMLDSQYINEYGITKDNAYEKINCIDIEDLNEDQLNYLDLKMRIEEMYREEKSTNIRIYFVFGNIKYNIIEKEQEYKMIIEVDSQNNTFSILPEEYLEDHKYTQIENLKNYNINIDKIDENEYNKFNFVNIEDSRVISDYLSNYKDKIVKNIEQSYDLLDEEYRKKRFNTYEEYEQYVKENIKELLSINFTKYRISKENDINEYICIDLNNNYYIFKETAIMEYKMYLDDYTVDSSEFIEKYNSSDEKTKVQINTEKIVKAINNKDYNYIYQRLDKQFVASNFPTITEFNSYMKKQYPEKYKVNFYATQEEGETYIQPIELISEKTNSINIIMQLKEGTDFVMSFGV